MFNMFNNLNVLLLLHVIFSESIVFLIIELKLFTNNNVDYNYKPFITF